MTSLDHVLSKIDDSKSFFFKKRNYNRSRVLLLSVASVTLSAIATLSIAATRMLGQEWLQLVALVATSSATVIGVWESVFAYRKLWSMTNVAMKDLDRLKRQIEYRLSIGTAVSQSEVDKYFEEFDRILFDIDTEWVKTYASK